jgi:hypothetical protein
VSSVQVRLPLHHFILSALHFRATYNNCISKRLSKQLTFWCKFGAVASNIFQQIILFSGIPFGCLFLFLHSFSKTFKYPKQASYISYKSNLNFIDFSSSAPNLHHFSIFILNFDLIQFEMNPFLLDGNRINSPMLLILKYFVNVLAFINLMISYELTRCATLFN